METLLDFWKMCGSHPFTPFSASSTRLLSHNMPVRSWDYAVCPKTSWGSVSLFLRSPSYVLGSWVVSKIVGLFPRSPSYILCPWVMVQIVGFFLRSPSHILGSWVVGKIVGLFPRSPCYMLCSWVESKIV